MRIILTLTAMAGLATAATATTTMHHHHAMKADSGSAAVRELNEKSLQQASATTSSGQPMASPAMSDPGAQAPADPAMSPTAPAMTPAPTDAAPATPAPPQ